CSTPDWRADARSILGVDPVQIKRNMVADRAASRQAQRFFHNGAHAALVNVAHGEDMHTRLANVLALMVVHVANAEQYTVVGLYLGTEAIQIGKRRWKQPHDRAQRHTMHIAARRAVGRVD